MLIEIDGPSGAGKTSLVGQVSRALRFAGRSVVDTADEERRANHVGWRCGDLMRRLAAESRVID